MRVRLAAVVLVLGAVVAHAEPLEITLTFDDGPKDHLEFVAPLLEKRGWRGTFNIPTDWIGRPKHVTWDDVRELQRRLVSLRQRGGLHRVSGRDRADADYEDFEGHKLDRKMLDLLKKHTNKETKR